MANKLIGSSAINLTNIYGGYCSPTPPESPTIGDVWNQTDPVNQRIIAMKMWDGNNWVAKALDGINMQQDFEIEQSGGIVKGTLYINLLGLQIIFTFGTYLYNVTFGKEIEFEVYEKESGTLVAYSQMSTNTISMSDFSSGDTLDLVNGQGLVLRKSQNNVITKTLSFDFTTFDAGMWTSLTLGSGFSVSNGLTPQYRIIVENGVKRVVFRGEVTGTFNATAATICTLPTAARPTQKIMSTAPANNGLSAILTANTNGALTAQSSSATSIIQLSNLTYLMN